MPYALSAREALLAQLAFPVATSLKKFYSGRCCDACNRRLQGRRASRVTKITAPLRELFTSARDRGAEEKGGARHGDAESVWVAQHFRRRYDSRIVLKYT